MNQEPAWQELFRGADPAQVRAVATTVEAMEYESRIVALPSGLPLRGKGPALRPGGLYAVQVRPEHRAELAGVLEQIIDEQQTFDESLACRDRRVMRWQHVLLGVMLALVTILALFKLVEL